MNNSKWLVARGTCAILIAACSVAAPAAGKDAVFHHSKIFDSKGKERRVDLIFASDRKVMIVRQNRSKSAPTEIPFDAIGKVAYGSSKHRRVKEGRQVMASGIHGGPLAYAGPLPLVTTAASILFGGVLMTTTTKSHWLHVDYQDRAEEKQLVLRLDGSEYKRIISTIAAQTGRNVEMLPGEERRGK